MGVVHENFWNLECRFSDIQSIHEMFQGYSAVFYRLEILVNFQKNRWFENPEKFLEIFAEWNIQVNFKEIYRDLRKIQNGFMNGN